MDTFRILIVTVLVIDTVYASMSDQGPQTFETSENSKKRETQGEATHPILEVPTQQQLQRPQLVSQPQYEISYQQVGNDVAKAEEPRYFTPNLQYRPQLHFVPLDAMEQFIHQYASYPSEQANVQNSFYFVQQPESESQKNQQREQEKEQRQQAQLQQRFNQQQQQEKQQLELEQQLQQQEVEQQQNQQHQLQQQNIQQQQQILQNQQHQLQQQNLQQQQQQILQNQQHHHQQQQILQNQFNEKENQQNAHTQYFIPNEPKLQLVQYQPQELFYGQQKPEYSQQNSLNSKNLPRQQFINIQYIAAQTPAPQLIEQKPQVLQIQLLSNARQANPSIGNHLSPEYTQQYNAFQQYAPNYKTQVRLSEISEEIEKSKLKSAAQAEAIARSPPVIVQKHVSITRHRPIEITKHVTVPVPSPIAVPIPTPIKISVPQPYAVPIEIVRPFAVPIVQTKTIQVDRPVPFEVEKRVPIEVEKKVYYKVDRPVPVEKRVPVEVTREIPVEVPIHKPQTLEIVRHVWEKKGLW